MERENNILYRKNIEEHKNNDYINNDNSLIVDKVTCSDIIHHVKD